MEPLRPRKHERVAMVVESDDGFALRRVPLYGWVALGIIGYALYHRQIAVALIAVSAWAIVKAMRGRL